MNPITEWEPEPARYEFVIPGTPFVLLLEELLSCSKLKLIDDELEAFSGGSGLTILRQNTGVTVPVDHIRWYIWLRHSCKGILRDGKKVSDEFSLDDIVKASEKMKDHLLAAGIRARALTLGVSLDQTTGDDEEKKRTTETDTVETTSPSSENSE